MITGLQAQLNAILAPAVWSRVGCTLHDVIQRQIDRAKAAAGEPAPNALVTAPSGTRQALSVQPNRETVLGILEKYPPTNEGMRQALPELQRTFPGVQVLEHPCDSTNWSSRTAWSSTRSWRRAASSATGAGSSSNTRARTSREKAPLTSEMCPSPSRVRSTNTTGCPAP